MELLCLVAVGSRRIYRYPQVSSFPWLGNPRTKWRSSWEIIIIYKWEIFQQTMFDDTGGYSLLDVSNLQE